jgi:hypothetical protein
VPVSPGVSAVSSRTLANNAGYGERISDTTMGHADISDPSSDRLLALEQELIDLRNRLENHDG